MGNVFWLSISFIIIFAVAVVLWTRRELGKCDRSEVETKRRGNRHPPAL